MPKAYRVLNLFALQGLLPACGECLENPRFDLSGDLSGDVSLDWWGDFPGDLSGDLPCTDPPLPPDVMGDVVSQVELLLRRCGPRGRAVGPLWLGLRALLSPLGNPPFVSTRRRIRRAY